MDRTGTRRQNDAMEAPPCRLFVLFARDADVAVVFRRGPSRWTQVIRWDTATDTFTDGAWFKGRIYAERCDLSPDGALLLSFCHGGASRPGYTDAWTAVSRPPWLHALSLWPWGTTYGGGGRFVGERAVILRAGPPGFPPHPDHLPDGLSVAWGDAELHASTDEIDGADWSGRDQRDRLVFCRHGKLFRRRGAKDLEVADFNGRTPDPIPAPPWGRRPLKP